MNRIAELREERNINQTQLADFIEVSQSSLSRWETEETIIDALSASKIADYFQVSLDYLFCRDSIPNANYVNPKELEYIKNLRTLNTNQRNAINELVKTILKK